ncbi:hypothetical protein X801_10806 [Opisthorchis viverrini]|uniref:Uncharacterized protein n=1 Tax=Opisthorchis viverrini TaxID=6198 RepID=A0A1S8WG42_OPIVI|nr:hypothetical protein X801_10806 [Opisthorchis viverrini]
MDPMVTLVGNGAEMKPFLQEEKTLAFWQVQFLAILGLDTGSLHRSQMTIFVLMYLLITSGHSRSLLDILENHSFLLTAVMVSIVSVCRGRLTKVIVRAELIVSIFHPTDLLQIWTVNPYIRVLFTNS